MAIMGRPSSTTQSQLSQVKMAPERSNLKSARPAMNQKEEEALLEKVTGKKVGVGQAVIDTSRTPKNQMGKDEFLKLLTFQLKNQDPMNPMEQDKFTAELAQFSQLEQLTNLNKKFDDVNKNAEIKDKFYASSFIGKQVITAGQSIEVESNKDTPIYFNLDKAAKNVVVRVFDEKGSMVGEVKSENLAQGSQMIKWNGNATDGYEVKPGKYAVQVYAWDENQTRIPVETNAVGLVESVNFADGQPVLVVNGKNVSLRDVKSFHIAQKDLSLHNNKTEANAAQVQKTMPAKEAVKTFEQQARSIYD